MRKLAERASKETKEISQRISTIQQQVVEVVAALANQLQELVGQFTLEAKPAATGQSAKAGVPAGAPSLVPLRRASDWQRPQPATGPAATHDKRCG